MKTNFKIALIKTLGLIVSFTLGFLFGTLMGEIIDYLNIERKKQSIAQAHNKTLETFPGIIYNYFLNIKPLEYKKGFVTKETKTLFNLK